MGRSRTSRVALIMPCGSGGDGDGVSCGSVVFYHIGSNRIHGSVGLHGRTESVLCSYMGP